MLTIEQFSNSLRDLMKRDKAMDHWLHQQVGFAYDALRADPSRGITAQQVRQRLAAEYAKSIR